MKRIRTIYKIALVIVSILFSITAKSQITELQYFHKTDYGQLSKVFSSIKLSDGLIISGAIQSNLGTVPVVIRTDVNGKIKWSTINYQALYFNNCYGYRIQLHEDGYIYGISLCDKSPSTQSRTMWKIDTANGKVEWFNPLGGFYYYNVSFSDYDSSSFVVLAEIDNSPATSMLAMINKADGEIIKSDTISSYGVSLGVAVDANKNVFTGIKGKLTKYNSNNFNQKIWEREYSDDDTTIDAIAKIYIDRQDNLFIIGRNGGNFGHGSGIVKKLSLQTGAVIWTTIAMSGDVSLADFKDVGGKLYLTFRHTLVGGGTYHTNASKVDKETGTINWQSYNKLPKAASSIKNDEEEAAIAMDVSCGGDVYLTGYNGADNYGPGTWGVIKLNGSNGVKEFDLYVTGDSTVDDELSVGLILAVFADNPIIVGHQQKGSNSIDPYLLKINPTTGAILSKNVVDDGNIIYSRTVDILEYKDSIYVLKQEGNSIAIEYYDPTHALKWRREFSSEEKTIAGKLTLYNTSIFISAAVGRVGNDNTESKRINIYELNKNNGNSILADSFSYTYTSAAPFDLMADSSGAYIYYHKGGKIYARKWTSSGISSEKLIDNSIFLNYFGVKRDVVYDNGNEFIIPGLTAIQGLNKSTMAVRVIYTYPSVREYFGVHTIGDTLYMGGTDITGKQIITAFNKVSETVVWHKTYYADGAITKILSDSLKRLYVAALTNNKMGVYQISSDTGSILWEFNENQTSYPITLPLDLEINKAENCLLLAGVSYNANNSSDARIIMLDTLGTKHEEYTKEDELSKLSLAYTIAQVTDTGFWVGGSYNKLYNLQQGFIYSLSCRDTGNIMISVAASIDINFRVWAYPNPTDDEVMIGGIEQKDYHYQLYDASGVKCGGGVNQYNQPIDMHTLPKGIYLITVQQNGRYAHFKIVKQ